MANKTITQMSSLSTPATLDVFTLVDVSDTTDSVNGTNKKITYSDIQTNLSITESQISDLGSYISDVISDTTPQLGGSLDLNDKAFIRIETAGESLVDGNLCYLKSDGKYWKADASAESTCDTDLLMCNATISADSTGEFIEYGEWTTTGLTAGAKYYISETAGAITSTAPTTSTSIVRIIGYAKSTTVFVFKPDTSYVENA